MAKTKFTRIAVAGLTASDGRTIEAQWLLDAAANYNPQTFTAQVNVEHIRNLSAEGPFPNLGSVVALKTQMDDIEIAGKTEKRLALYAQIDGNDVLKGYIGRDQKKFTSCEFEPNFSGTGTAYLIGLAATDSPASLGTEALQFSARTDDAYAKIRKAELDGRKQHTTSLFSAAFATSIEFEEKVKEQGDSAVDKLIAKFSALLDGKKPDAPKTPEAPVTPTDPAAAMAAMFTTFTTELTGAIAADRAAAAQTAAQAEARRASEFAALKAQIEKTPDTSFTQRPLHTGADGLELTDC